jgi:LmbE family N-acetylglucosaminyl deacetylase
MKSPLLMTILPHPDDESFPVGGTLARYAAAGMRVILVTATRGEAGIPDLAPAEAARLRSAELQAAARALGAEQVIFLNYVDGTLAEFKRDITARLVQLLRQFRPEAVITFGPDGISGHPDHVALSECVTRSFQQSGLPGRLFYIAPSEATQQGCGIPPSAQQITNAVASIDITDFRIPKLRAMQAHASQQPPYTGPPEDEAENLACHEYFALAQPVEPYTVLADLFAPLHTGESVYASSQQPTA